MMKCEDEANHIIVVSYRMPYGNVVLSGGLPSLPRLSSLSMVSTWEAVNASSNFYRFLCFYKILEGIFSQIRPQFFQLVGRRVFPSSRAQMWCPERPISSAMATWLSRTECIFHGCLPPSPWEGCHSVHVKPATQSTGSLPPSPREACHVDHGKVATHSRRSLPPSERSDAGRYSIILRLLLLSTALAVSAWIRPAT